MTANSFGFHFDSLLVSLFVRVTYLKNTCIIYQERKVFAQHDIEYLFYIRGSEICTLDRRTSTRIK